MKAALVYICLNCFIGISFARPIIVTIEESRATAAAKALRNSNHFDGDIILPTAYYTAIANNDQRWTNNIVLYEIDEHMSGNMLGIIYNAMRIIEDKTCIKFSQRLRENERDYVYIHDGESCSSMVGRAGGRQPLSLGENCNFIGTVLHELMHAIGFYHEHSRSDRDDYLDIHMENVDEKYAHNFAKMDDVESRLYEPFNHYSIMIYGETSFSKNGYPTMTAKNGIKIQDPIYKTALTPTDIRAIQTLYRC